LEVRNDYRFCALTPRGFPTCEPLSMPMLPDVDINRRWSAESGWSLELAFPATQPSVSEVHRSWISKRFLTELWRVQKLVEDRIAADRGPQNRVNGVGQTWAQIAVSTRCQDDLEFGVSQALRTRAACGNFGAGVDPPVLLPGNLDLVLDGWVLTDAGKAACTAACNAAHDRDMAYCKIFPEPRRRAICRGAAMARYGGCLASC